MRHRRHRQRSTPPGWKAAIALPAAALMIATAPGALAQPEAQPDVQPDTQPEETLRASAVSTAEAGAAGTDFDVERGLEPFFEEQQLASNGEGGWPNYRIPALMVTNDGDLLASYDGRPTAADSPAPNSILQRRSTDGGQTWQEQTIINEGSTEEPIEGYSDPSYLVDRQTGSIFAFHVKSYDAGFWDSATGTDPDRRDIIHAQVARSDDGGHTWTDETITEDITPDEGWTSRFAAAGQGIQLKYGPHAGRLIQQYTIMDSDGAFRAVSVYSDDHGETWQAGEPVGVGMDENKTVELSDGRVMLNSRDSERSGYRKVAISEDGGHSYGEVYIDEQLPDPANNGSIIRAFPNAPEGSDEAQVLLFSNAGSSTERSNGVVRMSCDDGETWPASRVFARGGMAYSTLVTQADGSIGLLYEPEGGNGGIRYANFSLAWLGELCAGMSAEDVRASAGSEAEAAVQLSNQEAEALTGGQLEMELPDGWGGGSAEVAEVPAGSEAEAAVAFTVPEGAAPGSHDVPVTFTSEQGSFEAYLSVVVTPADEASLAVDVEHVDPGEPGSYTAGDRLRFDFSVTSFADEAVDVVPSGPLDDFDPRDGAPNCRYLALDAGGSYDCDTASYELTQEDIDAGVLELETAWSSTSAGEDGDPLQEISVALPPVPLTD